MEALDFSEDEIEHQLAMLGYNDIPKPRLREFKTDLDQLINHERSKSHSSSDVKSPRSHNGTSGNSSHGPAVVREKLQSQKRPDFGITRTRTSLQERLVLHSIFAADNLSEKPEEYESFTRYSVPAQCPPTSAVLYRLHEDDPENLSGSILDTSKCSNPHTVFGVAGKPFIKRKVLRKQSGHLHIFDESMHNEDSADRLEDHLERLQVSVTASEPEHLDSELDCEAMDSLSEATNAFQAYSKSRSRSENDVRAYPKSFIRPQTAHPHTQNLKKTDPVAKYFQYKQDWKTFKAPGEDRKGLRSDIREHMMYKTMPPRKLQKIYIPNSYKVPTEKKRSALRWEVRHDLANGIPPPRIFYPS